MAIPTLKSNVRCQNNTEIPILKTRTVTVDPRPVDPTNQQTDTILHVTYGEIATALNTQFVNPPRVKYSGDTAEFHNKINQNIENDDDR